MSEFILSLLAALRVFLRSQRALLELRGKG